MSGPRDQLVFLPLGGVGEIGMNLALYGFGPAGNYTWIMVDCGITFGDVARTPGVDIMMPDIAFVEEERKNLAAILITHAHEDHYGALIDLWPRLKVPVYATAFAAGMLAAKQASDMVGDPIPVTVVEQGASVDLGPFRVEFIPVSHSVPEPNALAITTPLGTVVHSADWKIDTAPRIGRPIAIERLKEIGAAGVRALVSDSTNALREGRSPSEAEVAEHLKTVVARCKNRVAVTLFSSNVARIRAAAEAAEADGRRVVVMGRAMHRVIEVARELGYLDGLAPFLSEDEFGHFPRDKVLVLLTGSQGEDRAALSRIARDDHPRVSLSAGDLVIFSSRTIPGNEKAVITMMNGLAAQSIDVLTDRDELVHVSGHPRREELVEMFGWLKPELVVPVHGEQMHLRGQADLARASGVPEVVVGGDGRMIRLAPGPAEIIDEIEPRLLYREGRLLLPADESGVPERRRLAYSGAVSVTVILDGTFRLEDDPYVALFGVPERDGAGENFEEIVEDAAIDAIESIPRNRRRDLMMVEKAVRRAVRSTLANRWGKKPSCKVVVIKSR